MSRFGELLGGKKAASAPAPQPVVEPTPEPVVEEVAETAPEPVVEETPLAPPAPLKSERRKLRRGSK
jgi:hypothetical protein